jgi:hypothetical protein
MRPSRRPPPDPNPRHSTRASARATKSATDTLNASPIGLDEIVWNGRPISLIVPAEPLEVFDGKVVPLIELIPPVHQRVYKMGLEHLGVVVGDGFDAFVLAHKPVLTGQQFQGPNSTPDPVYILFEDFTHVKFYRLSLRASVELDAGPFDDGFHHVEDWLPQRLVTATGPNPLPR